MPPCYWKWADDEGEDDDGHDPDALAEVALARLGLDGLDERDPVAVLLGFGVVLKPLPLGEIGGCFDPRTKVLRVCLLGGPLAVRRRLIHECGHVILWVNGIPPPHVEPLCDSVGRVVVMGRGPMVHRLARMTVEQVVAECEGRADERSIRARVSEVYRRMARLRSVG